MEKSDKKVIYSSFFSYSLAISRKKPIFAPRIKIDNGYDGNEKANLSQAHTIRHAKL